MEKTTIIYHSADFDGLFCREIARHVFGDSAEYVGWDFSDKPLAFPKGRVVVMDLPVDRVFGFNFDRPETIPPMFGASGSLPDLVWIDHHKSSIATHPASIPGYRIDGVAACRLAWQWFVACPNGPSWDTRDWLPDLQMFRDCEVAEPTAVRLAGEYDVSGSGSPEAMAFQYGLRTEELKPDDWTALLGYNSLPRFGDLVSSVVDVKSYQGADGKVPPSIVMALIEVGHFVLKYKRKADARTAEKAFLLEFEDLKFLAVNSAGGGSAVLDSRDKPETGHDALMVFFYTGKQWVVSMYHAGHRKDVDLSVIAARYGGGGHAGACGFTADVPPHLLLQSGMLAAGAEKEGAAV